MSNAALSTVPTPTTATVASTSPIDAMSGTVTPEVAHANDAKADLKAKVSTRTLAATSVAVTDVEAWLAANPNGSARDIRIASRFRDALRRKLGEK